jgi:hypothetical protein
VVDWIKDYLADVTCLDPGTADVLTTTVPFSDDFSGALDPAKWTALDSALRIYGRLELEAGGGYGSEHELGTARTRPMALGAPATISFRTLPANVPSNETLRVQWFNTTTFDWEPLVYVYSPGGYPTEWTDHEITTPPEAVGDFFAVRWSAYGTQGTSSAEWRIDDVLIEEEEIISAAPGAAPAPILLRSVQPNPFNARTTVSVTVDRARPVRITVRDLNGREVAVLADRELAPGEHAISWDGRDGSGQVVASGIYLIRLESHETTEGRKVVLIK